MPEYKKVGYLTTDFKMFHLKDEEMRSFHYHYHDFHKILILLNGDVTYCIEGRSYDLKKNDIVLVHAGEVHKPVIHSDAVYDLYYYLRFAGFSDRIPGFGQRSQPVFPESF